MDLDAPPPLYDLMHLVKGTIPGFPSSTGYVIDRSFDSERGKWGYRISSADPAADWENEFPEEWLEMA